MYKDIIVNYGTELKKYTGADLVENDVNAYRIVYRTPWDLTGCTVKALCRRSDGTVVSGMGIAEGTNAVFVMDSSMYAVPGELTVRLTVCTAEEQVITVCDIAANAVESFGDGIPGTNSKSILDQILINETKLNTAFEKHYADKSNPHTVTKAQVGLENVDNVRQAAKADFDAHTTDAVLDHPDGSVTAVKIAAGAVTEDKITGGAVTAAKIADDAISESKLNTALKTKLNGKADKGTKLSDYAIADAYTKSETDKMIDEKAKADDVYTKTQTDTKLDAKENAANKVSEISDVSTDEQYPSAKAVNDIVKTASKAAEQNAAQALSNALKGSASGENAVRIDDSSPIEHEMSVKVSSKNLIPYPYADTTKAVNGITFTDNGNGTITASGTAAETAIFAPYTISNYFCLKAGTYIYSDSISNPSTDTYYSEIRTVDDDSIVVHSYDSNKTFTVAEATKLKINLIIAGEQTVDLTFKPQVEYGVTATEYTPYISDLTSVTLTQRGKNLLPYVYTDGSKTYNTMTYTRNDDGTVNIDGTSAGSQYFIANREWKLPKRIKVTHQSFSDGMTDTYYAVCSNYNGTTYVPWIKQTNKPVTMIIPSGSVSNIYKFEVLTGTSVSNKKAYPIVELGDTYTGYEPVLPEVNYTPSADGIVTGVKNIYPTITLLSDTDGVVIDVEYNRDINKAFEELKNAVLSSGGNV